MVPTAETITSAVLQQGIVVECVPAGARPLSPPSCVLPLFSYFFF